MIKEKLEKWKEDPEWKKFREKMKGDKMSPEKLICYAILCGFIAYIIKGLVRWWLR